MRRWRNFLTNPDVLKIVQIWESLNKYWENQVEELAREESLKALSNGKDTVFKISYQDKVTFYQQQHNHNNNGASPNSHKHFFPYMGFCASIWDNVRHHCHHHHHHHIQKSKSINTEACLIAHWLKLRYGLMMQAILGHAGDFITVWKKEKSTRPHGNPLCFPKNIFCLMWCNWKRMAVLESA